MSELSSKKCVPCRRGDPPLGLEEIGRLSGQLDSGWEVIEGHHLEKGFEFKNFAGALGFANRVGELAEAEGHHPDLVVGWGKVVVTLWTHKAKGLTESDFILASKIDSITLVSTDPDITSLVPGGEPTAPSKKQLSPTELENLLSRFGSGVGHELNNLLTIIQGNAALLENLENPQEIRFVQEIVRAAKRAGAVAKGLDVGVISKMLERHGGWADQSDGGLHIHLPSKRTPLGTTGED